MVVNSPRRSQRKRASPGRYCPLIPKNPKASVTKTGITIRRGTLPGYTLKKGAVNRHRALLDILRCRPGDMLSNGTSIARKLVLLSTLTKNTNPVNSLMYKEDAMWLKRQMQSKNKLQQRLRTLVEGKIRRRKRHQLDN